mgnify:CR=1 FL=1
MSKDKRIFDLEERLGDFAVIIIRTAESRSDFIHKMKVCLKELRETRIWLLMMVKANLIRPASKLEPLVHENNELISIFVTSVKTAKQKEDKKTS